ncbi:MAG: hypothetical protein EOM67_00305 [Spirochaetia bacterium]|nr:hypothetical protein [Spirochaetia bacterium]
MSGKTLRSIVKNVPVELILSKAIPESCYLCRFLECTSSCNLFNVRLEKKGHSPLRCEECKSIFNLKEYSTMEI